MVELQKVGEYLYATLYDPLRGRPRRFYLGKLPSEPLTRATFLMYLESMLRSSKLSLHQEILADYLKMMDSETRMTCEECAMGWAVNAYKELEEMSREAHSTFQAKS
ncbi:MAG: hypothetical protein DRJ31_06600 [Candidatus Methanomethylicota archaeon]|uniref:Uncharacterized protein n=1 Tax=Thermoproteota archaeon TaxID=2056631 RepID=A0A497EPK6_9CREN|nr:MAG: hypothetical protein DRJ31_06600 [Candidatus Verstraetearchaeota archaeon]RLE49283.1 MAG: hypothetical protein DRJ33_08415 [Candidatus Verstraetearchaeota archaeon]